MLQLSHSLLKSRSLVLVELCVCLLIKVAPVFKTLQSLADRCLCMFPRVRTSISTGTVPCSTVSLGSWYIYVFKEKRNKRYL